MALLAGVGVTWYTWLEQGRQMPASLINSRFDILLSNQASEELFWEWHTMPCVHKNTLWCCVTEPTARGNFPEYEGHVRYLVARLRSAYSLHVGDPDWDEDIRRPARSAWPSASSTCRSCRRRASSSTRRGTRTPGPGCR